MPRLAVLYFELLSPDPGDAYLAAGLTEDLIVDFTRVARIHVTSRGEVLAYRDRAVPPRTLARELNVDYVLQGSVRRAGNRARISAQLIRAGDGHVLWGERFDRTLEDLFDVQAEVSKRIVEALQVTLGPGEREMLDRAPTRDAQAYALYLEARQLIDARQRGANLRAEELLKRSLARDPAFALAHAALGECYAQRGLSWWAGLEAADLALPHARRALELEPDLLEAHLIMGMIHRLRGDADQLRQALERVIAMDPEHAQAQEWIGWGYMSIGQPERAVGILERLCERHPDRTGSASFLLNCYEMLHREADAARWRGVCRERLVEAVRRDPDNAYNRSLLAGMLVAGGEREAGIEQAERAVALAFDDARVHYNAACAFAQAGRPDRAMAELEEGIRNVPSYVADWPRRDPDLANLHELPEFIRLFGKA
jgi:adenylate cyclase